MAQLEKRLRRSTALRGSLRADSDFGDRRCCWFEGAFASLNPRRRAIGIVEAGRLNQRASTAPIQSTQSCIESSASVLQSRIWRVTPATRTPLRYPLSINAACAV
jgi:hypothetical protein